MKRLLPQPSLPRESRSSVERYNCDHNPAKVKRLVLILNSIREQYSPSSLVAAPPFLLLLHSPLELDVPSPRLSISLGCTRRSRVVCGGTVKPVRLSSLEMRRVCAARAPTMMPQETNHPPARSALLDSMCRCKVLPRRAPVDDEVVVCLPCILACRPSFHFPPARVLLCLAPRSRRTPARCRGCCMSSLHSACLCLPFSIGTLAPASGRRSQAALGRRPTARSALLVSSAPLHFPSVCSTCPPRAVGVCAAAKATDEASHEGDSEHRKQELPRLDRYRQEPRPPLH